jgi:hypothetical protein
MIPDIGTVLGGITRTLMLDIAPEVTSPYGSLTIQISAGLLSMIAQETERAASRLHEENDALRRLFASAGEVVADPPLGAALANAVAAPASSLLVGDLRRENQTLRALLVRLHAYVETLESAPARALESSLWQELVASTQRRQLDLSIG